MTGNVMDTNHVEVTSRTNLSLAFADILDISGIQFFDSLEQFTCSNNQLTSLPSLPTSLVRLYCDGNQLTSLPVLPNTLVWLQCEDNQLTSLPTLPSSLTYLRCNNNQITSLPTLPASLTYLNCAMNQLSGLPTLPTSLTFLLSASNQLTNLPSLPATLTQLECNWNQLTSLPDLPDALTKLACNGNQITSIAAWAASLEILYCSDNQLTSIPSLPGSLTALYCYNNQLSCLPELPTSLDILRCQNNLISCLPNFPANLPPFGEGSFDSDLGFIPVLCSTADPCFPTEVISGTLFSDDNGNGIMESGEGPLSFTLVEAQPGDYLGGVDINGNYSLPVDAGSYTVQGRPMLYHSLTTAPYAVTISAGSSDTANHIGYMPVPGVHDLVVSIQSGFARPGFENNVWLEVRNFGTEPTTATIDLDLDADQVFVSSSVVPAAQSGTNVNWSVAMNPGVTWAASVTLSTPASVLLGTTIDHLFAAIPASVDTTPANNAAAWSGVVVASYDPNDKTSSAAALTPTQVQNGDWVEYLIRFQNTGTFMAEHVRITDSLSTDLQWDAVEYLSSSHPNYWYLSNGTLVFQFDNIQLPDSNTNEPDSHGFVKFRVKADPNLTAGEQITNVANIYFDFNEPVITDPCVVLIEVGSGVVEPLPNKIFLYPNPTSNELNIAFDLMIERFQLYSSDGRLVLGGPVNAHRHHLNLSGMDSGLYLLELYASKERFVERFVIED